MYEPYVDAMATFFVMELPGWIAEGRRPDD
jgi:hypothetical protein